MRRLLLIVGALAAAAIVAATLAYAARLLADAAARSIFRDTIGRLPDGLHVGFCGAGSPFPAPTRSGPCTAVVAGGRFFVVDAGRGASDMIVHG